MKDGVLNQLKNRNSRRYFCPSKLESTLTHWAKNRAGSGIDSQIDQTTLSVLGRGQLTESTESLSYLVLFCDCMSVRALESQ